MRVMVCGGSLGAAVSSALDKLGKLIVITGIVWGPDEETSNAALEWWGVRFFAPNYVLSGNPDVVVILPGATAIQRLREAMKARRSVVVIMSDGRMEVLEGSRRMAWGIA